jgi:zinc transporter 1/2/3
VVPGYDNLERSRQHQDTEMSEKMEVYMAQLTSIFILEFGIVFHSVFIGLTLVVSGEEFTVLYIVIVFHQTFEGLGLDSELWRLGNFESPNTVVDAMVKTALRRAST